MPVPLVLTFVSTVAFAIQLLIFAYLYSSHRVRFFQYLLLAWGAYTLSKGLKLVDVLVLDVQHPSVATEMATVHAVFITLYFLSTFAVIIMVLERARSESERLHARLRDAERLATAGELAAGMAHEIRNPLAAIVNATALLTDEAGLTRDERAATVEALRAEARRLNRILSDFLRYARPQEARRAPGDIREVVQHVGSLIRDDRSRAARVDVRVAVDPSVPRFAFDRDQVTQVLWNVALNGVEAMNGRGRLSLEVAREGGHVALAVSDTGPGIPHELLPRVFEPFYSGKPNGSGLGLTIAERIVAAHGGRIEIDTAPGSGTRVTLRFPIEAV